MIDPVRHTKKAAARRDVPAHTRRPRLREMTILTNICCATVETHARETTDTIPITTPVACSDLH